MARKTNYQQEKRQRELQKQRKKELKKERKQNQQEPGQQDNDGGGQPGLVKEDDQDPSPSLTVVENPQ